MAYLIVQYWEYLAAAAGLGVLVGWWAQGSRHGGRGAAREGES
ncbi:hypothetical protein [Kaistia algarum]|nr:hypothetical protein [Kaistia algarum]MCX5515169.1 hypothetical protein [Kaistia algarum]